MSAASCLWSEDQFLCSICLDVFTDPVSTPCGHNFCKTCITQHWNVNAQCVCPVCKEVFYTRPELKVNTLTSEMTADFIQSAKNKASGRSEQQAAKPGEVQCDVLTGTKLKAKLWETIQQRSQQKRLKIQKISQSAKLSREAADRDKADGVQVFITMKQCVEKRQDKFIETMEENQKSTEKRAADFIKELQQEISELMEKAAEVEKLSRSDNHLHLLQSFSSVSIPPPTRDWTQVKIRQWSREMRAVTAMAQMKKIISEDVQEVELKRVQQFAVVVTFDPDTAQSNLILDDNDKEVMYTGVNRNLPDVPQRFDPLPCVLGKQSFSSGRFYFEVEVDEKPDWVLGVTSESSKRKGDITLSPEEGYWTICLRYRYGPIANADPPVYVRVREKPKKVGVFVDHEDGLVSFHGVDCGALIYSFTGCSFTHKLLPFFCTHENMGGRNCYPLIISAVGHPE